MTQCALDSYLALDDVASSIRLSDMILNYVILGTFVIYCLAYVAVFSVLV